MTSTCVPVAKNKKLTAVVVFNSRLPPSYRERPHHVRRREDETRPCDIERVANRLDRLHHIFAPSHELRRER